jgi:hypothetical protein
MEMIEDIKDLLRSAARKSELVPLHALLWTIDGKHHAIPTVEELNIGLQNARDFRVERTKEEVVLVPSPGAGLAMITSKDIAVAMAFAKTIFGGKRKQPTDSYGRRRGPRG